MSTKTEQATALHKFLQNEDVVCVLYELTENYHPMIVRPAGDPNAPWLLTQEEVEDILHIYHPHLSATVVGPSMVIFREKKE